MTVETKSPAGKQFAPAEVVRLVAEALGVPSSRLNAESAVGDVAEWDSMGILSILTAVGREGMDFDADDLAQFQSMSGVMEIFRANGRLG